MVCALAQNYNLHRVCLLIWAIIKPEHSSGGPYGKITFRLASSPIAWHGGQHRLTESSTVRAKMLELVRRQNTIWVE